MSEKFDFQQYRDNLAEKIKNEPNKSKREDILGMEKYRYRGEYKKAKEERKIKKMGLKFDEGAKNFEIENTLNPEIVEKIMDKVMDINTPGFAVKSIYFDTENLSLVLKTGLVGSSSEIGLSLKEPEKIRLEYKEKLLNRKFAPVESSVYFNIMGRSVYAHDLSGHNVIKKVDETNWTHRGYNRMGLIFDLGRFKEVAPTGKGSVGDSIDVPFGAFCNDDPFLVNDIMHKYRVTKEEARKMLEPGSDFLMSKEAKRNGVAIDHKRDDTTVNEGLSRSPTEYGFLLNGRVVPRDFKALFINLVRRESFGEQDNRKRKYLRDNYPWKYKFMSNEDLDKAVLEMEKEDVYYFGRKQEVVVDTIEKHLEKAAEIGKIQLDVNGEKSELLLPIYDMDGNLLWPKKMSYDKVREFVAEKEEKMRGDSVE